MINVYLAGAMRDKGSNLACGNGGSGAQYDRDWRTYAKREITRHFPHNDLRVIDPYNGKENVEGNVVQYGKFDPFQGNNILHLDSESIHISNIILANFLPFQSQALQYAFDMGIHVDRLVGIVPEEDNGYPMIGTLIEMGIAISQNRLIVVVTDSPRIANHPFVRDGAARIVDTVQDGARYVVGMASTLVGQEDVDD